MLALVGLTLLVLTLVLANVLDGLTLLVLTLLVDVEDGFPVALLQPFHVHVLVPCPAVLVVELDGLPVPVGLCVQ